MRFELFIATRYLRAKRRQVEALCGRERSGSPQPKSRAERGTPGMRFELFIATRYLRAKRRQAFIGVITGISILGVAAGVASLIVALAVNNGFRQDLQSRLLGSTSHISLLRVESDGIRDWRPLLEKLSKQPHVETAAPAIYEQVLISRGPRARGAVLKGMLPHYERKVSDLLNTVTLGSADALSERAAGPA